MNASPWAAGLICVGKPLAALAFLSLCESSSLLQALTTPTKRIPTREIVAVERPFMRGRVIGRPPYWGPYAPTRDPVAGENRSHEDSIARLGDGRELGETRFPRRTVRNHRRQRDQRVLF